MQTIPATLYTELMALWPAKLIGIAIGEYIEGVARFIIELS
jgi:hypothetical protein